MSTSVSSLTRDTDVLILAGLEMADVDEPLPSGSPPKMRPEEEEQQDAYPVEDKPAPMGRRKSALEGEMEALLAGVSGEH